MKVLVTGGAGYIGSHTILSLIHNGHDVVSIDNFLNSSEDVFNRIQTLTGISVKNYDIDLCDYNRLLNITESFDAIIHFAALKSVPESIKYPFLYKRNNLQSLKNILRFSKEKKINKFVFSSSCSVYGNINMFPVDEQTRFNLAESPYAETKQMGELIVKSECSLNQSYISLRYFNPAGAHASGKIGEKEGSSSLVPIIVKTGLDKNEMVVNGSDYPTRDGTCIRDYVHVCDIAEAHVKSITYDNKGYHVFNLGSEKGMSVLEMIKSFEEVSGIKISYTLGSRRIGDVIEIYSNSNKAREYLNWFPRFNIKDIIQSEICWQNNLRS